MQKRLSSKDFILYTFLTFIIFLLLLAMYQVDRQWDKLTKLEKSFALQSKDIGGLRTSLAGLDKKIEHGVMVANVSGNTGDSSKVDKEAVPESFKRAYAATQKEDYAMGDWKTNSFTSTLKTLTPLVANEADTSSVHNYVLESLITRNPDTLEQSGLLAKSWTISDDGLVIAFKLYENIVFSDGVPMTAEDVVFTFDFTFNKDIKAPAQQAYFEPIKSVKAIGKYEVVFTFRRPYFEALGMAGGMEILPKHFYEKYLGDMESFNTSKGLLLGSGPYKLADPTNWSSDEGGVDLVRNPRYWGAVQPPYDKIVWRVIENASARLTTYRNGDLDAYGARAVEYKKLKNDEQIKKISHNFEYMAPTAGYSYLAWNELKDGKKTIFADKRVRQAMTYLTDREKINKDIYLGYAEVAMSPFSPRSKQHDKSLSPRKPDLQKALALLKEAGFEDRNGDGVLDNAEGKDLEFELVYAQSNEDTGRTVLLLKDMYARAGIKLIPKPTEWPVMIEMLNKKTFDVITLGWTSGLETDIYQMFHSSQAKTDGNNFISYKSDALDKIIEEARVIVDEDKRMPIWRKAEAIFYEDQPYTFLKRSKSLVFINNRFKNLQMTGLGLNSSFMPIETYVPKSAQKYQ
jgi:peptide/nickel transport system substrate-binding protein